MNLITSILILFNIGLMTHTEFNYLSSDKVTIYGRSWQPDAVDPVAVVALIHGMGEHSGRYAHVAKQFTDNNIAVFACDLQGHGKTTGKRGHVNSYDDLLHTIDKLIDSIKERHPGLPVILYGHSMGGNLVLNYVLRRNTDLVAVVSTSPWLKLSFEPPAIKIALAKLARSLAPTLIQSTNLNTSHISRDEEEVKRYENDPLNHDKISTTFFFGIHESGLWAIENADKLNLPALLMHGTGDRITSYKASKSFADKAGEQLTYKEWEGYYHEMHNDIGKEEVISFIVEWVKSKI